MNTKTRILIMTLFVISFAASLSAQITKTCMSFVLTNEGDNRMIDSLAAKGCTNLYEALVMIRQNMNLNAPAVLTAKMDALIDTLNSLSHSGEVFTASLGDFAGPDNSPVGINADGTFIRSDFSILTYDGHAGYARYSGNELITYAAGPEHYIYLGSAEWGNPPVQFDYYAFAVAWSDQKAGGVEEPEKSDLTEVYPNPFNDGFYLNTGGLKSMMSLFNTCGQKIMEKEISGNTYVPAGKLPNGEYLLEISCNGKISGTKIIKTDR